MRWMRSSGDGEDGAEDTHHGTRRHLYTGDYTPLNFVVLYSIFGLTLLLSVLCDRAF